MLDEFVLLPTVFDRTALQQNPDWIVIIEELLWGMRENGLLGSPAKGDKWEKEIQSRLAQSPNARAKVLALISVLKTRNHLIQHSGGKGVPLNTDAAWLDAVCHAHQRARFAAIFCCGTETLPASADRRAFVTLSQATLSTKWKERKNSIRIDQCEVDFAKALTPLLRYAERLDLVDPYFSPIEERFITTLILCADLFGKRPRASDPGADYPKRGTITVHTWVPEPRERDERLRRDLDYGLQERKHHWMTLFDNRPQVFNRPGMEQFSVLFWSRHDEGYGNGKRPTMHDRYIFTDQCGVQVPGGLDCRGGRDCRSTEWCLLDWDVYGERSKDYPRDARPGGTGGSYKLLDRLDYRPT